MPEYTIRRTSTWRTKFMRIECDIFDIQPADWRNAQTIKLKDLGRMYNSGFHEAHVVLLNTLLELHPPLDTDCFSGETTLGALRILVDTLVPSTDTQMSVVLPNGIDPQNLGIGHMEL